MIPASMVWFLLEVSASMSDGATMLELFHLIPTMRTKAGSIISCVTCQFSTGQHRHLTAVKLRTRESQVLPVISNAYERSFVSSVS